MRVPKKLMIVEDSVDLQDLLHELLSSEGYEVHRAYNGQEALDFLDRKGNPNLILLDLMMPKMDGFEFRKRQKNDSRFSEIPVVIMSAHGDALESKKDLGEKYSLRKPLDLERLLEVIQIYCD